MDGLVKSIHNIATQETDKKVREKAVNLLNGIITDINEGIKIWTNFQKKAKSSDKTGLFGGWAGFSIERELYDLQLKARSKANEASNGGSSLDAPLVALAYNKLHDDQNAAEAVEEAIKSMQARIGRVKELISEIQTTKPVKPKPVAATQKTAMKPVAKAPAKTKSTTPKTAKKNASTKKKQTKASAPKKSTKKKLATKKKPAKKPAAKKQVPVKKKSAKKKTAVKKKAVAKKGTGKKKVATKKTPAKKAVTKKSVKAVAKKKFKKK